jgi:serine/threonine-protein kinase
MTARVLGQRYELGDLLGSGGMGQVWRAYDHRLGRPVAVKLLAVELPDQRVRERFEREARAAAAFSHANAVTVYDFGEDGNRPFLVMELVEGRTLAALLAERGPLPVPEAVAIADQVLAALSAAHRRGLVHRDVKPGNILVTADGRAKLADFGIAVSVNRAVQGLTGTGQIMGTPQYLSPEQVGGEPVTHRTDLYAAGIVLYEALAGEPPFTGDVPVAVALAHRQSPVPPLRSRRPDVPPAVADAVERALEKDPGRRFPDAEAMRAALAGRRAGHGSRATAVTVPLAPDRTAVLELPPEPAARPPARRRRRAAWLVLALLAGAAGLALALAAGPDRGSPPGPVAQTSTTAPARATTSAAPSTTATTRATTTTARPSTTVAPTTVPVQARTLAELLEALLSGGRSYGSRAGDLAERIEAVNRANGNRRSSLASDAIEDVQEWISDRELDPTVGALAIQLLAPLAR